MNANRVVAIFALCVAVSGMTVLPAVGSAHAHGHDILVCGGCVDTSDLSGLSVTTDKIGDGAVTTPLLANGAVTRPKIANKAVGPQQLKNRAVTSAKLANGAVTAPRLADGAVLARKMGFANAVFIDAPNSSKAANCDALIQALDGLVGPASVYLGPGEYNCGTNQVVVPASVALKGAGKRQTIIRGPAADDLQNLVSLAENSLLQDLTVRRGSSVTGFPTVVATVADSIGVELINVLIDTGDDGIFVASGSSVTIRGSEIFAGPERTGVQGVGVLGSNSGGVTIIGSTINAHFADFFDLENVVAVGSGLAATTIANNVDTATCHGSYDLGTLAALPVACQ